MKRVKKARFVVVVIAAAIASAMGMQAPASAGSANGPGGCVGKIWQTGKDSLSANVKCPANTSVRVSIEYYGCSPFTGACGWVEIAKSPYDNDGTASVSYNPPDSHNITVRCQYARGVFYAKLQNKPSKTWYAGAC